MCSRLWHLLGDSYLLLDWEALKRLKTNCMLRPNVIRSRGLGEVSVLGFVLSNLGLSLGT